MPAGIPINHVLLLSTALFCMGVLGIFLRRNLITLFMCIELMLNAANLAFVAFSRYHAALYGQGIVFFVMTVAAAEAAVGLAIVIALQRHRDTLDVDDFHLLKW